MTGMQNSLELNIHNFQSIQEAVLEFPVGISLIVGPSSSGKSASIRAIKTLLQNPSGSQRYIQHNKTSTNVQLNYKGNVVKWQRLKKDSKYTVNDEEYIKIGSSDLFDYLKENGFALDEKGNIINIEGEWDVPFPFGNSSAELFKLFENVFCVSDSGEIFQLIKTEESNINKELVNTTEELNKSKGKLEAIKTFESSVDILKLKTLRDSLVKLNGKYNIINSDVCELEELIRYGRLSKDITVKFFDNVNLDKYTLVSRDIRQLEKLIRYVSSVKGLISSTKIYTDVLVSKYERLLEDLNTLEVSDKYRIIKQTEIKTFDYENLQKYKQLSIDISELLELSKYTTIKDMEIKEFSNSSVDEYTSIKKDLKVIREISAVVKGSKVKISQIDDELKEVQDRLKEVESKLGQCKDCPVLTKGMK